MRKMLTSRLKSFKAFVHSFLQGVKKTKLQYYFIRNHMNINVTNINSDRSDIIEVELLRSALNIV